MNQVNCHEIHWKINWRMAWAKGFFIWCNDKLKKITVLLAGVDADYDGEFIFVLNHMF